MLYNISDHKAYNTTPQQPHKGQEKQQDTVKAYITIQTLSEHCSQVRDIDMEAILILYYQITYSYIYIYY